MFFFFVLLFVIEHAVTSGTGEMRNESSVFESIAVHVTPGLKIFQGMFMCFV
jgi:hypothetical protein